METRKFYVVRINGHECGSFADTFAAETLDGAIELAMPDKGDRVEWCIVHASDAGAARVFGPDHRGRNAWRPFNAFKVRLYRVRLNGDYEPDGRYWGCHSRGSILYRFETGAWVDEVRAADREDAKRKIRAAMPEARFYR